MGDTGNTKTATARTALYDSFVQHVCQTSDAPLGLVVARAQGSTIWDVDGLSLIHI